jgi:hypothetical protein
MWVVKADRLVEPSKVPPNLVVLSPILFWIKFAVAIYDSLAYRLGVVIPLANIQRPRM